jgi:hypothetical protein
MAVLYNHRYNPRKIIHSLHISMQCLGSHVGLYFATVYICIYEMFITLVPGANVNKNTNYDTYVLKLQSNCK